MKTVLEMLVTAINAVLAAITRDRQPQTQRNEHRPYCPNCGRELVFAAIVTGDEFFSAWLCDCDEQPEGVRTDIVRAREWDEQSMVYEVFEEEYDD